MAELCDRERTVRTESGSSDHGRAPTPEYNAFAIAPGRGEAPTRQREAKAEP